MISGGPVLPLRRKIDCHLCAKLSKVVNKQIPPCGMDFDLAFQDIFMLTTHLQFRGIKIRNSPVFTRIAV